MAATRVSDDRGEPAGGVVPKPPLLEGAVEFDFDAAVGAFHEATRRFTRLVRSIDDPSRRTRGLDWTLGDTAAHVLLAVRYDLETMTGARSPHAVENDNVFASGSKHNAEGLREYKERDPNRLADGIQALGDEFIAEARRRGPRAHTPVAGGRAITVADLVGVLIAELLVHGYDIARTIGGDFDIDADAARIALYSAVPFLPLAVDPVTTASLDARIEIRVRGGDSFVIHVDHGTARGEAPSGRADLHVSADPVGYLLVAYGRSGPWSQLLRGRMFAWGRRPSLAFKLPTFFRKP